MSAQKGTLLRADAWRDLEPYPPYAPPGWRLMVIPPRPSLWTGRPFSPATTATMTGPTNG